MRGVILVLVLLAAAGADGPRKVPLLNVEILDAHGVQTTLVGFHRISGEDYFRGYLGSGDVFDGAISEFAARYADRAQADHASFEGAIESGRLESREG